VNLYNTDTGYRVAQDYDCEAQLHGIALTKLVAHMEDFRKEVFKLTDLTKLYKNWLKLLGAVFEGQIYSLRLKDMLLSVLLDLKLSHKASLSLEKFLFFCPFLFYAICQF